MAPSPVTLNAIAVTNGNFRFSWSASPGATYRVQAKTNLTDLAWNEITTVTSASNLVSFSEATTEAQRFYRIAQ